MLVHRAALVSTIADSEAETGRSRDTFHGAPERRAQKLASAAVLLLAAVIVAYCWFATDLRPFTVPIDAAVAVPSSVRGRARLAAARFQNLDGG